MREGVRIRVCERSRGCVPLSKRARGCKPVVPPSYCSIDIGLFGAYWILQVAWVLDIGYRRLLLGLAVFFLTSNFGLANNVHGPQSVPRPALAHPLPSRRPYTPDISFRADKI